MLAIRLQRQGRKGYPVYRIVVQEAQRHPSSGRVVAFVGSYNPHTKEHKLDKEKIEQYLGNGAQPTPRVVKLLVADKIKLPEWVEKPRTDRAAKVRFADKLRKNQPKEEAVVEETPAKEAAPEAETPVVEEAPEEVVEAAKEAEEPTEAPAKE
jgi:small subunit ribosomal protein S16